MEKRVIPREKSQHLKKWDLASFDNTKPLVIPAAAVVESPPPAELVEPTPIPEKEIAETLNIPKIALPTAAQLEELHDSAYQEGHDAGFADGFKEGKERGFAEGFKEGEAQGKAQGFDAGLEQGKTEGFAHGKDLGLTEGKTEGFKSGEEELAQQMQAIKAFSDNFQNSLKHLEKNIAQDVLKLAIAIAQAVLHKELSLPQSQLMPILQDALTALPNNTSKIVVRLNPADRAFLKDEDFPTKVFDFVEDKRITRGGCQVDFGESSLDARIENRWQRTLAALGDETPWNNETPFASANQSVVSENPALSTYLEKNLLAKNANQNVEKNLSLAVENPEVLATESSPHPNPPNFESEENNALGIEIALPDDL